MGPGFPDGLDWIGLILAAALLGAPLLLLAFPRFPFLLWKVAQNLWVVALAILFTLVVRRVDQEVLLELFPRGLGGVGVIAYAVEPSHWKIAWQKILNPRKWWFWAIAAILLGMVTLHIFGNPLSIFAASRLKVLRTVLFCTDRSADDLVTQTGLEPDPSAFSRTCEGETPVCASLLFGEAKVYLPVDSNTEAPSGMEIVPNEPEGPRIVYLPKDEFYRRLSQEVEASPKHDAFLFVHGFRNSFQDALNSTAGLAVNLKLKGAAIAFSWPAEKGTLSYIWQNYGGDSRRVPVGANDLAIILPELRQQSNAQLFHVIAHSIGSTLTAQAELQASAQLCHSPKPFENTILAAPDITPELFNQQVGAMQCESERLTIYFSHSDMALLASMLLQEGRRIGAGAPPIPGADVIDATAVDPLGIGHSYVFSGPVLHDIFDLLQMPTSPATDRIGIEKDAQTGAYRLTNP